MSKPSVSFTAARSQKLDFFFETDPLSSRNLEETENNDPQYSTETPSPSCIIERRGNPVVVMAQPSRSNEGYKDYKFEMDVGEYPTAPRSILRKKEEGEDEKVAITPRRRISWNAGVVFNEKAPPSTPTDEHMKVASIAMDEDMEVPLAIDDNDAEGNDNDVDDEVVAIKVGKPKRKYEKKKKTKDPVEAPSSIAIDEDMEVASIAMDDDTEVPLAIDYNSDDEKMLMIDEGEDEVEVVGTKAKKNKKKSHIMIKKEIEESLDERNEMLEKVFDDDNEEIDLDALSRLVYTNSLTGTTKKEKKYTPKSVEHVKKEITKSLEADPAQTMYSLEQAEMSVVGDWDASWMINDIKEEQNIDQDVLLDEVDSVNKDMDARPLSERGIVDDMPDIDNSIVEDRDVDMDVSLDGDKRRMEESDGEEKKEKGSKKKKGGKGGGGSKKRKKSEEREETEDGQEKTHHEGKSEGHSKKRKEGDRPLTEDEVLAEIGRKKAEALEKATRMKIQKAEDRERKREELEKKKEEDYRKREEMRRHKIEARENKSGRNSLVNRQPRSRAEAARRTKQLLALGSADNNNAEKGEENDVEEPKRKKRQYRKRDKMVSYIRRLRCEGDDEGGFGCGKYIDNPCDYSMEEDDDFMCSNKAARGDEEEEEMDDILSMPVLWTSTEDRMNTDEIGPLNYDHDECVKRHVSNVEKFSNGLSDEYRRMINKLDGMRLDLFADSTHRRFQPRVIHNIDFLSTISTWPLDLLPAQLNGDNYEPIRIPKYQHQIWNRPFRGLVRIRPAHIQKDQLTSKEIDEMTGGGVAKLTKEDIVNNLDDLIKSKLEKKSWNPLPSIRNPFDVPEISTRRQLGEMRNYQSVSYVDKVDVMTIPCENTNKKKRKTRKEVLMEISKRQRLTVEEKEKESIYKEPEMDGTEDKDGWHFEWDEMGEMPDNPMRDNPIEHFGDDPFATNPYQRVDYDGDVMGVEDTVMNGGNYVVDNGEETEIGEALSYLVAF